MIISKKESFRLEECEHIIREVLQKRGTFRFYPKGTSMLPFVCQGRDMVVLAALPEKLERYQIILYKRNNGAFVLHRIVGRDKDSYTMRGDNQFVSEPGIRRDMMIGMVTEIIRNEKPVDVNYGKVRLSAMLWVKTVWIRKFMYKFKHFIKKLVQLSR